MRSIERICTASDLTMTAVEDVMRTFHKGVGIQNGTLIVSETEAANAGYIREEFAKLTDIGLGVIVLPDAMFATSDTWALMNESHQVVWSPGA